MSERASPLFTRDIDRRLSDLISSRNPIQFGEAPNCAREGARSQSAEELFLIRWKAERQLGALFQGSILKSATSSEQPNLVSIPLTSYGAGIPSNAQSCRRDRGFQLV
jgi:hypothetical protein